MYGMRLSIVGVPQLYYLSAYLCVLIVIFFIRILSYYIYRWWLHWMRYLIFDSLFFVCFWFNDLFTSLFIYLIIHESLLHGSLSSVPTKVLHKIIPISLMLLSSQPKCFTRLSRLNQSASPRRRRDDFNPRFNWSTSTWQIKRKTWERLCTPAGE